MASLPLLVPSSFIPPINHPRRSSSCPLKARAQAFYLGSSPSLTRNLCRNVDELKIPKKPMSDILLLFLLLLLLFLLLVLAQNLSSISKMTSFQTRPVDNSEKLFSCVLLVQGFSSGLVVSRVCSGPWSPGLNSGSL